MVWWRSSKSSEASAPVQESKDTWGVSTSNVTTAQERFGNLPMDQFTRNKLDLKTNFDEDDFEDLDTVKKKMGYRVQVENDSLISERAKGCGLIVVSSSMMGVCIGLASGSLIGMMMAPSGQRFPTAVRMMKQQAIWFGIFFSAGGLVGCGKKYF